MEKDQNIKRLRLLENAEAKVFSQFERIDRIASMGTARVLNAFRKHRVSESMFSGTTGYGYDDKGRDVLDAVLADIMGTEDALIRINFVSGTHTITCGLFGALMPGQTLVSAVGAPYDTLHGVIGIKGNYPGSLRYYGIGYREVAVKPDGTPDMEGIAEACKAKDVGAVLIQRSRGYFSRKSLSVEVVGRICDVVKNTNPNIHVLVDNCYGEFVEEKEPSMVGADLIMGSLIKNAGGGLAPTGGYLAGKNELVEAASMRMTAPGLGRHLGCTMGQNRALYQGLFMAPHTVAQALKTAVFCASVMEELGFAPDPLPLEERYDIIQSISFGDPEPLLLFCEGIQAGAPVDSYVTPVPGDMPGYDSQVVMAAGSFIQGASIELSCDAPMREPYTAYMQGGLTYESGKAGILLAVNKILDRQG